MRSILLVIFSALVLAGIFLGYWLWQPRMAVAVHPQEIGPVAPLPPAVANSHLGSSSEGWFRKHGDDYKVESEFRGSHFEPRANGTIDVTSPVANFYLAGGQHLNITGETGNIVMKQIPAPAPGKAGLLGSGPTSPPSRGRLDHVVVKLIDDVTGQAILTMRTRNIVFDNETFSIATEGYHDENGIDLAPDEVPVHILGQESGQGHGPYLKQMEGRGLKARWNDRDGRLEFLEIAHGDFLIIDNASSPVLPGTRPKAATLQATTISAPLAGMLASADPQGAGQVIAPSTSRAAGPKPAPRAGRSTIIYRASFLNNVRIQQPDPSGTFDQVLIDNISQMDVDFQLGNGSSSATRPGTMPGAANAPASTTSSSAAASATPQPDAAPAAEAAHPDTAPATQPGAASQIIIHWTGRMFMAPLSTRPWSPLRPGDGAVKLIGQPMHMHRIDPNGGGFEDVHAASALYATAGDHLQLDRSNRFPSIFIDRIPPKSAKDQRQTHVVSANQVLYQRDAQIARCIGPGFADVPMEGDANSQPATMHATWTRLAEFAMTQPAAGAQLVLREGHFAGDVDIQHPRMSLRSDALDLYFDQIARPSSKAAPGVQQKGMGPTTQQTLKQAVATTNVYCQFIGTDGKKQAIEGNRLVLDTSLDDDGKSYPSHVNAAGSVHAFTDDELRADNLDAVLKPAAKRTAKSATRKSDADAPPIELQQMVAWGSVVAKSKDGSIATGDKLTVTQNAGKQHAVLASAAGAKVINPKGNLVTGPEIEFDSAGGKAYVIGAGHMEALSESKSTTQPAQKITVAWSIGAQFDGAGNRIDADGDVKADFIDSRGFHDEGHGDHARVDLQRKAPTTQPAQVASAAEPAVVAAAPAVASPTTAPATAPGQMDFFRDKEFVAVTLEGHATLNSTLPARDGSVEQQMILRGPRIIMTQINPDGSRSKSLSVPSPGDMLVRDHRQPGTAKKSDTGGADLHGAILFTWQHSLYYSEATMQADMKGDVDIKYNPSEGDPMPATILGDRVTAYFDKPPTAASKTAKADDSTRMHLRLVSIFASDTSTVTVVHGDDKMTARQVDFDPANHMLTGIGTEQNPVVFFNGSTGQSLVTRVDWDTLTWNPHMQGAILGYHPHADTTTPKPKAK